MRGHYKTREHQLISLSRIWEEFLSKGFSFPGKSNFMRQNSILGPTSPRLHFPIASISPDPHFPPESISLGLHFPMEFISKGLHFLLELISTELIFLLEPFSRESNFSLRPTSPNPNFLLVLISTEQNFPLVLISEMQSFSSRLHSAEPIFSIQRISLEAHSPARYCLTSLIFAGWWISQIGNSRDRHLFAGPYFLKLLCFMVPQFIKERNLRILIRLSPILKAMEPNNATEHSSSQWANIRPARKRLLSPLLN